MQTRLFLTGPSGCGKSTMILQALGDNILRAGGFVTERQRDENGNILGFALTSADGRCPHERFLDFTGDRPQMDLQVFNRIAEDYLQFSNNCPFAVMDELGGVELLDDRFVDALAVFLAGHQPCIGVMKGPGPAGKLVEMMGLTVRYELARRALYEHLRNDPDTLLIETTGFDDAHALEQIRRWVDEYVK